MDSEGNIIGYGQIRWWQEEDGTLVYLHSGVVDPEHRRKGHGSALLNALEAKIHEVAATHDKDAPKVIGTNSSDTEPIKTAMLEKQGYGLVHSMVEMEFVEPDKLPDAQLPEGFTLRESATPEEQRKIYEANKRIYEGTFGSVAPSEENFKEFLEDIPESANWKVVWHDEDLAGFVINTHRDKGAAEIMEVAVLPEFRRQGLAGFLMAESIRSLQKEGAELIRLHTDADGKMGGRQLYESIGFKALKEHARFRKPIEAVDQEAPSESLEDPENVLTYTKPIRELPEISLQSVAGEEFWGRSKLRPEGEGGNYHNMPVLKFGIDYDNGTATLSVPTAMYLNEVVRQHNPGGFTFVELDDEAFVGEYGQGAIDISESFLGRLAKKEFPFSSNRDINYGGVPDTYVKFKTGKEEEIHGVKRISLYEHDRVDHAGLAAIPPEAVDKVAKFAQDVLDRVDPEVSFAMTKIVAVTDRVLDLMSEYAIIPAEDNSEEIAKFRSFVWEEITAGLREVQADLGGYLYPEPEEPPEVSLEARQTMTSREIVYAEQALWQDYYMNKLKEDGLKLELDKQAFDENIRRMQSIQTA